MLIFLSCGVLIVYYVFNALDSLRKIGVAVTTLKQTYQRTDAMLTLPAFKSFKLKKNLSYVRLIKNMYELSCCEELTLFHGFRSQASCPMELWIVLGTHLVYGKV